jgi:hypothetical protein
MPGFRKISTPMSDVLFWIALHGDRPPFIQANTRSAIADRGYVAGDPWRTTLQLSPAGWAALASADPQAARTVVEYAHSCALGS